MRTNNPEKFRNELFDNLQVALFANCSKLSETFFNRTEENKYSCCALYDCLQVVDYYNPTRKFYVTMNDECDVIIWKVNKGDDHFTYVSTTANNIPITKTQLMMSVAVDLQRAMNQW